MPNDILLPRILLTNDDGFDSPGLQTLAGIAAEFTKEIWIVAPAEDQSGAAQKISLREAIRTTRRGERSWAIKGTPSDCVALALDHLMADARPNLVLSGINATSNVGDENNLSGTVGAALTALMLGVPAIAISQDGSARDQIPWDTSREVLPLVLRSLLANGWRKETVLSINIPNLPPEKITGYAWARQAQKNIAAVKAYRRISPRNEEYFWLALHEKEPAPHPQNDIDIMASGLVSVTTLSQDRSVDVAKPPVSFHEQPSAEDENEHPRVLDQIIPADEQGETSPMADDE